MPMRPLQPAFMYIIMYMDAMHARGGACCVKFEHVLRKNVTSVTLCTLRTQCRDTHLAVLRSGCL